MNLCTGCKHIRPRITKFLWFKIDEDFSIAKCSHPDLVSKADGYPVEYCKLQRDPFFDRTSKCGSSGKLFEAKV